MPATRFEPIVHPLFAAPTMPRFTNRPAVAALVLACLTWPASALANELTEVQRLHRTGQPEAALARARLAVSSDPDSTAMRFLLGVLLADAGRSVEATTVFQTLAQDHPELAEAHNNLAALHAAAGHFDKARAALEQALRAKPDDATAHENLGDVYAKLAGLAYARAASLDPANAALPPKLALVSELFPARR